MADRNLSNSPALPQQNGGTAQAMQNSDVVLVYTTFPSQEDAKTTGRALIEGRLAACVNIFPPMISVFVWEGKLQEEAETAMIVKTTKARSEEALAEISRLHPYSIPARIVLPVAGGGADFLQWIGAQCSPSGK